MFIFNIRILHMGYYFQIDTLLFTKKFLLLLEIKNYTGHIYFDDKFGQLVRKLNDKLDYFEDPLEQVRQKYHLLQILKKKKFPDIPIEHLIVFSNKNSFVDCSPT
nr:nuclease-related domain-containing protein [Fictibacillus phosphorivorans]